MRTSPSPSRRGRVTAALVVAVVTLATMVTGARPASACSCTAPPAPETAAAEADAVFVGEVADVDERDGTADIAHLAVTEVFTGDVGEEIQVHTPPDSAACGYPFEVGRVDLVYAVLDDEGRLQTNLCDRTAPVADADEDLAALGSGEDPRPRTADDGATGPDNADGGPRPGAALAVLLLAAAAVAIVLGRRSRPRRTT